jgi:hypothetical protein
MHPGSAGAWWHRHPSFILPSTATQQAAIMINKTTGSPQVCVQDLQALRGLITTLPATQQAGTRCHKTTGSPQVYVQNLQALGGISILPPTATQQDGTKFHKQQQAHLRCASRICRRLAAS